MTLFGHTSKYESLSKMILQGSVEDSRKNVLPKGNCINDILGWTILHLHES